MKSKYTQLIGIIGIAVILFGFKPPKNVKSPKDDILYSKYGGNVDSMLKGERRLDSINRPFLYQTFEDIDEDTVSIDDESVILDKAEKMPQFEGGQAGLTEYLKTATTFIADTLIDKKANVVVKFYVNTFGDAKNPKIIKTDNPSFDLQTLLIIENMPKWTPATQHGKNVNCYITLPIQYGF